MNQGDVDTPWYRYRCDEITAVVISSGVTNIGDYAFFECSSLTYATIPNSVTSIGSDAFSGTPWLHNLGEFALVNGILLAYQGDGGDVAIPTSVTSIGESAFSDCRSLTSVVIPNSVTAIGALAFSHCYSLTSVTIPDSVTSICEAAFNYCSRLTDVYYGGSEAQWNQIAIGEDNEPLFNATIHYNS